jgi:hypothetical protein
MNITLAEGDDWEGLYIDGICYEQNHTLSASDVLSTLKDFGISVDIKSVDEEWMEEEGYLPEYLKDVKWEDNG